jgi:V/A-type H+-transporting ATPase subunit I
MKKVCLVVQDKNQSGALARLRETGVMHLEQHSIASEGLSQAMERMARADTAMGLIQPYKTPKKKEPALDLRGGRDRRAPLAIGERRGRRAVDKMGMEDLEPYSLDAVNAPERPDLINLMVEMDTNRKSLEDRQIVLGKERARIAAWGSFTPESVRELIALGLPVFFYELTHEAFKAVPKEIKYFKISQTKTTVRIVTVYKEIPQAETFKLPEKSLLLIDEELAELRIKRDELESRIKSFADRRPTLKKDIAAIQREIEFESAKAELVKAEGVPEEYGFSLLKGYVPSEDLGKLKAAAAENGWALTAYDPGLEDRVPTKLKNSKFVQLLYPLTNFLDVTPDYRETDVSVFFLLFFTIFYAMIFGDAGYGSLVLLGMLFAAFKTAKTGVPAIVRLLLLLSAANVGWGLMTCSWFGIETDKLPQFLQDISLSYLSPAKTEQAIINQNIQIICFSLGVIHLSIARIKRFIINIRSLKALSELGSLGMVWGMYNVVLFLVVSNSQRSFPMLPISMYVLAGGFGLTFLFAYYEGNIFKSILSSFQNIIPVVLSITGVFADVMSYIRLWAVGLAGAAIASTVNTLASPLLSGLVTLLVGVVILAAAHSINFTLSALGVLVHGVRLNTLEFSQHVGIVWSGTKYRPFALKQS